MHELEYIFHPKSVAVVGASTDPRKWGNMYVELLLEFGFKGKVYAVNPNESDVLGLETYSSLRDIREPVDYVISTIAAELGPELMEQCVAKGVKVVQFYTARLAETGEPDRIALERKIVEIARRGGIRLLGPNCMGIYYPEENLSFRFNFPRESGHVGSFCQSAGNTAEFIYRAAIRGVRFSKVIHYGNASDLNESDFIDYLAQDPQTTIIGAYIEGVRDGPRFYEGLKRAARKKPVAIYKPGRTEAGARALASHTASLSGSAEIWDGLCRQTGAIRIGLMGSGGGGSISASDECESVGLTIPRLRAEQREEVKKFAPYTWMLINNPLDSSVTGSLDETAKSIELIGKDERVDFLIYDAGTEWMLDRPQGVRYMQAIVDIGLDLRHRVGKPMALIIRSADCPEDWRWQASVETQERCIRAGMPVFPTTLRAVRAISRLIRYHEQRDARR
jgi:acyl-CoA synthetase (NDP forming)